MYYLFNKINKNYSIIKKFQEKGFNISETNALIY